MATLVRWDPFREIAALQGEMGRFLGMLGGNGTTQGVWAPAMDAWETDDEVVYAFDLPGITEDDISIEFDNDTLTIGAERERTQEVSNDRYYRAERRYGSYRRTIGLPAGVTENDISARTTNGVLEVHVKKPAVAKPRRIPVGTGGEHEVIEAKAEKSEQS
jgi:HSP20 family protein